MKPSELRCERCGALLAMDGEDGVTIKRGGMEAKIPDATKVIITCYCCSKMNPFQLKARGKRV